MSDDTPPIDPLALMREAYARGVEAWSEAMEELVGSEEFAAGSGRLLALYAQQQEAVRTAAKLAAESVHMPTAEDLAAVARLVVNVERKVDELTETAAALSGLDARLAAAEAGLARIAPLERAVADSAAATVAGLDERLRAIESAVKALGDAPATKPARKTAAKAPAKSSRSRSTGASKAADDA